MDFDFKISLKNSFMKQIMDDQFFIFEDVVKIFFQVKYFPEFSFYETEKFLKDSTDLEDIYNVDAEFVLNDEI